MYKAEFFCFLSLITLLVLSACGGNQTAIDAAVQQTIEAQSGGVTENTDENAVGSEAAVATDVSEGEAGATEETTDITATPLGSWEGQLVNGGVWLAQMESPSIVGLYSYLMVFTPEGNVLFGGDVQATFEITDSTLTISSTQDDYHYVEEYDISVSEDENTIILSDSFVDGSGNTLTEVTTLTHHSEYQPTSLSSLNLENSFWGGGSGEYIDFQSNIDEMIILAFTSDEVGLFTTSEEANNLPVIRSIGDFTITEDAVFLTLGDNLVKFSVGVFNRDTIILTSDETDPFILQDRKSVV